MIYIYIVLLLLVLFSKGVLTGLDFHDLHRQRRSLLRIGLSLSLFVSLLGIQEGFAQCIPQAGQNVIGGRVFQDVNSNGLLDGETGTNGISVHLYEDMDDNGVPDGPWIQTAVTDGSGDFRFILSLPYSQSLKYNGTLSQDSDDAREKDNNDVENDKDKVTFKDDGSNVWNALRFNNISIPANATIDSAFLYLIAESDDNDFPASAKIYGQDNTASPATFSEVDRNISNRARTNASVSWSFGAWTKDLSYQSPDLTGIVKEIVSDQSGLNSGSIALLLATEVGSKERNAYSHDKSPSKAPQLIIYYSVPLGPYKYLISPNTGTYPVGGSPTTGTQKTVVFSADGTADCDNDFGYFACTPNCPPGAADDNSFGEAGTAQIIDVLSNDHDPEGNLDLASLQILTQPANGTASILNGKVVYVPNGSFSGYDNFSYQICDNNFPSPICASASVTVGVGFTSVDVCANAAKQHTYYLPYPSDEAYTALAASASNSIPSNNLRSVVSLKIPYPTTVVIWDHWEDGYEANIRDVAQSSTQIWGDGRLSNGFAPGFPEDIIPAGASIVLDQTMPANPRNPVDFFFDGKDKIVSSSQINVTQVCGEPSWMPVQTMKTAVTSVFDFGQSFTVPVGEDFNSRDFQYTALLIRASADNTTVNLDKDNDGSFETTFTLNEGEVHLVDGGVLSGATLISDAKIGVEFHSGGVDNFSVRNSPIFPSTWYSDTYYTPVPTADNAGDSPKDSSVVMLYNSLNRAIDIDWFSGIPSNGTLTLPAKSVVRFPLAYSTSAAYKFVNPTGESFVAMEIVDSYTPGGGGGDGRTYDWSFNLISEERLSDYATLAWAPGGLDLVSPPGPDVNGNPLWVTPSANTAIYVKYDGDLSDGGSVSPCGFHYDVTYPLNALNYVKIKDLADKDQSGTAVFTCDGTKISVVYGADPTGSGTGLGVAYWDVGLTVQPSCASTLIFANEDFETTPVDEPILIGVLDNDGSFLTTLDKKSLSTLGLLAPANGSIIVDSKGRITYTPNTGFQGTDYFEYQVCSEEDPGRCDIAQVTVKVIECNATDDNVLINGFTYLELDPDNGTYNGEILVPDVVIDLYNDDNGNGLIDPADDFVIQSELSRASGAYTFSIEDDGDYIVKIDASSGDYNEALLNQQTASFTDKGTCVNERYLGIRAVMVAEDDSSSGIVDNAQLIAVLTNDLGVPDPASLDTTGLMAPANGSLILNPDGSLTYIPDPGYTGIDSFEYRICSLLDPNLCDVGRVDVEVSCLGTPGQNDINGLVFDDANNNGIQDPGEIGTSGITVNIFENNAPLASRGPEDVLVGSATTDAFGNYSFSQTLSFLVAGTPYQQRTLSEDDDAREKGNGNVETNRDLQIPRLWDNRWNGMRFTGITLPADAVITNAYVQFTSKNNQSGTVASVRFYGEDGTANPPTFVHGSNGTLRGRARTTSIVDWVNMGQWNTNNTYNSPDLSPIIQEIVDEQGGLTNGAIVLITEAIGSNRERRAYDFGANSSKAPQLMIEYAIPFSSFDFIMEVTTSSLPPGAFMTTDNVETVTFTEDGTAECGNNFGYFAPNTDEDNDGISDLMESGGYDPEGDEDGDGTLNWQDTFDHGNGDGSPTSYVDANSNGVPDVFDADGDGIPNFLDLDSDNDGIADIVEARGEDTDGDGRVDNIDAGGDLLNDADGDGLDDLYDGNAGGTTIAYPDTDGDGLADPLDLDSDQDGIPDLIEAGGLDTEGNGRTDGFVDIDGDGFNDLLDGDVGNDYIPENSAEVLVLTGPDTNGDGVPDNYPMADRDGDGVLNLFDLDADNDGILDVEETGAKDLNGDGIADGTVDEDADGFLDVYDPNAGDGPGTVGTNGLALILTGVDGPDADDRLELLGSGTVDGDGDDVPNFLDIDSDNDGIYDQYESQPSSALTTLDLSDSDSDGIDDVFDDNDSGFGGAGAAGTDPVDTDGDTLADYLDKDSDDDGVPDWQEAWDSLEDGDSQPDATNWSDCQLDSDGDGLVDCFDNDDGDIGDWTISFNPPSDDGTGGSPISAGIDLMSSTGAVDVFPNNAYGDLVSEPDFRDDGNASCSSAQTVYALTDIISAYQFNPLSDQHETGLNTGLIRATAFCTAIDGWYRFYNPLEPDRFLFAIQNGTNTEDLNEVIDYVEIEVQAAPVVNIGNDSAFVAMARSWHIVTKGELNGSVNIRFYFTDQEHQAFDSVLNVVSLRYIGGATQSEWFKVNNGLDYANLPNSLQGFGGADYTNLELNLVGNNRGQADGNAKGNNKNYVQFNGLTSFSGGTLGGVISGTLPVEWLDFSVVQQQEDALLDWATASETQVDYFGIERSVDGNFFQEIGKKEAVGNSQEPNQYFFRDQGVIYNLGYRMYYRIRQVDQDGSFSYSEVLELNLEDHKGDVWFVAMPVPVDDILTIRYDLFWEQGAQLELITLLGSAVQAVPLSEKSGTVTLNVSRLPAGIYYLRLQGEDRQMVRKIEVSH
jgi:hypothetical protein